VAKASPWTTSDAEARKLGKLKTDYLHVVLPGNLQILQG